MDYNEINNPAYAEEIEGPTSECVNCLALVPENDIKPETNNHCVECQKIDFCNCGEPISECNDCTALEVCDAKGHQWDMEQDMGPDSGSDCLTCLRCGKSDTIIYY